MRPRSRRARDARVRGQGTTGGAGGAARRAALIGRAWRARSFTGQALWTRMHNSFGYLTQQGYLGVRFPVVFGETGSFYTSVRHHT